LFQFTVDCNVMFKLCFAGVVAASAAERSCHAISPAASDDWCNSNCNYNPPNCPASLCKCDGPGPSPSPSPTPTPFPSGPKVVGGYLNIAKAEGLAQLKALADNAATLPINRIWIAFLSPSMLYTPGSKTLVSAGMQIPTIAKDAGFADLQDAVSKLQAGGVEVFLSMGGWNYNCFPYFYANYSVGGYGTPTPNYWKVTEFCDGSIDNANVDNQFCYVCEPKSEGTDIDLDFSVFPEPATDTWKAATKYVEGKAGSPAPKWNPEFIPGKQVTDSKTGKSVKVPGSSAYADQGRDPYVDFVYLAKDLNVSGVDLDYEEMWHADYHKTGSGSGPFKLDQTTYKYAAIVKDTADAIKAHAPSLKLSTAAAAVGAWSGKWWGGNLKGVWLQLHQKFPELSSFMTTGANAGGINVMTYDLSDNTKFHECPTDNDCELEKQVAFYMNTYQQAGIPANVGYEIGTPAYPDPKHDKSHQLPLSKDKLSTLVEQTQGKVAGGFFWELYKPADGQASPTEVAQAVCNKLLPGESRCSGVIPTVSPSPPAPSPVPSPTPSDEYKCQANQCVPASGGVSKAVCSAICGTSVV